MKLKKILLMIALACSITILPLHPVMAQNTCPADLEACIELLDECDGTECPPCPEIDTCKERGWVTLAKDEKLMASLIGSAVLIIGAIAGLFISPN